MYLLFGWAGSPLLLRAFTSCSERVLLSVVPGLLIAVASLVTSPGSRHMGSVVVAHELNCPKACGILPGQGSKLYPLRWQADSYPLYHQESPGKLFLMEIKEIFK